MAKVGCVLTQRGSDQRCSLVQEVSRPEGTLGNLKVRLAVGWFRCIARSGCSISRGAIPQCINLCPVSWGLTRPMVTVGPTHSSPLTGDT